MTSVAKSPRKPGHPASPWCLLLLNVTSPKTTNRRWRQRRDDSSSTLPVELEGVAPQPAGATRTSLGLGELASLAQASGRFASGGKATEFPVLHDGSAHPVDLGVTCDGLVVDVDHDDLEVLVGGVL